MKQLAVFDLDGTLIAGDSFSDLVRMHMFSHPSLLRLALARKIGLLGRGAFAAAVHGCLAARLADAHFVEGYVAELISRTHAERTALIRAWRDRGAFTLLMSASPNEYVQPFGGRLGFDAAIGSHGGENGYVHLWGAGKRAYLDAHYPVQEYDRVFAIADSESDEHLLSGFAHAERCPPLR